MPPIPPSSPAPSGGLVVDRSAEERRTLGLLERERAVSATRVLIVRGDAAPVREDALVVLPVGDVPSAQEWAFLGRGADGEAVLLAVVDDDVDPALPEGAAWAPLRAVGGDLTDTEAVTLRTAVALAGWLRDAPFCPACGTRADVRDAGWSRHCPNCGREHFPRTDPAVIVLVVDEAGDRVLLGANAVWGGDRYSCFAGFVEAGESLEETVAREVKEEANVRLRDVVYRGSQVWPYPRSLMLGFRARVESDDDAREDGEEIVEVRWFTRAELGAAMTGESGITLPGPASIARRLIDDWYGEGA